MLPEDQKRQRVVRELSSIVEFIETETGLRSNWSGELRLESSLREKGSKPFTCEIVLRADLVDSEERWRTWIHEALHSFSAGFNFADFAANRGWEEGVVEKLQRLIRSDILAALGVTVDQNSFFLAEQYHPFNEYIEALERIRREMNVEERPFYIDVLGTPIRQRYAALQAKAVGLPGEERARLVSVLSAAHATLTRRFSVELF